MTRRATKAELQTTRNKIKAELPRLYDLFWTECDRGKYFVLPIPKLQLKHMRPRNELLWSGTSSIRLSYGDFVEHTAMAFAAESLAQTISEDGFANHFRFGIRNRDIATAIRSFFRFFDHATFHLNELSDRQLLARTAPRKVSFQALQKAIDSGKLVGPPRLVSAARFLCNAAGDRITLEGQQLLREFRNADTHRYVVGIDHISYGFSRDDRGVRLNARGRLLTFGNLAGKHYSMYGVPDIDYPATSALLRACLTNAKAVMVQFCKRRLIGTERS